MTRPLLYKPTQRWRIVVALAAAILIHAVAIALAINHLDERACSLVADNSPNPDEIIESLIETTTPDRPAPPVAPTLVDEAFRDLAPVSHPVLSQRKKLSPIGPRNRETSGLQSFSIARANAVSAPRPEYPYEARRQRITGNGIVTMRIDFTSGTVTNVLMEQSTGSLVLDQAALVALRRWRFKPGTVSDVRTPVTFTLNGSGVTQINL